jgi:histidyl-tRNA synthetase
MASKPSIPKGLGDFSPTEVAKRNYIIQIIKGNFEKFGFQPIETPSFENSDTLISMVRKAIAFKILNSGDYFTKANPTHLRNKDSTKLTKQYFLKSIALRFNRSFARYVVQHQTISNFHSNGTKFNRFGEQIVRKRTFQRIFSM